MASVSDGRLDGEAIPGRILIAGHAGSSAWVDAVARRVAGRADPIASALRRMEFAWVPRKDLLAGVATHEIPDVGDFSGRWLLDRSAPPPPFAFDVPDDVTTVVLPIVTDLVQPAVRVGSTALPVVAPGLVLSPDGVVPIPSGADALGIASPTTFARALERLAERWAPRKICLVNLFRRVTDTSARGQALRARIGAFNLAAMELSSSLGLYLADADAQLAHVGGQKLGCDFRASNDAATDLIAGELVRVLSHALLD